MTDKDTIAVGRRVLETEAEALGRLAAELDGAFAAAVEALDFGAEDLPSH